LFLSPLLVSIEQLISPGDLAVTGIANLDPARFTIAAQIRRELVLGDDAFEILFASEVEEILTTSSSIPISSQRAAQNCLSHCSSENALSNT